MEKLENQGRRGLLVQPQLCRLRVGLGEWGAARSAFSAEVFGASVRSQAGLARCTNLLLALGDERRGTGATQKDWLSQPQIFAAGLSVPLP